MKFRQSLFWDTDPSKIDLKANAVYVMERVMDFGRDDEVRWLWNNYNKEQLMNVVRNSRTLRPETKTLWKLILQQ